MTFRAVRLLLLVGALLACACPSRPTSSSGPSTPASVSAPPGASTAPNVPTGSAIRVMPLGDTITDGYQIPGGWRLAFLQRARAANLAIDFVGSMNNGPTDFDDREHEAHSGWEVHQIDAQIVEWLRAHR